MRVKLLAVWLCNCLGLLVAAAIIPAISYRGDVGTLLLAGAILALVNFALRPIVVVMTLPAVLLSLGVALLFINTLMLWLTSRIVTDLSVGGFWSTFAGALLISIVNLLVRPKRVSPGDGERAHIEVSHWR